MAVSGTLYGMPTNRRFPIDPFIEIRRSRAGRTHDTSASIANVAFMAVLGNKLKAVLFRTANAFRMTGKGS
jgi:hypothetical protein